MRANHFLQQICCWFVGLSVLIVGSIEGSDKDPASRELKLTWSLTGDWTGVAGVEGEEVIYALDAGANCLELDLKGKKRREFKLKGAGGTVLRLADWPGQNRRTLLTFGVWSSGLTAFNLEGKQLWSYPRITGIDDVWTARSNEQKAGDVIVGFNGGTGLHVLDEDGQVRWKSAAIGNVWHVSSGDVLGDGTSQAVTTSSAGKVHVFDNKGNRRKDLDAGCYANMVRVGKLSKADETAMMFVGGSTLVAPPRQATLILTALSSDGGRKWTLTLPDGDGPPHIDSAMLAVGKPWLVVAVRGGQVHVVDVENGEIIATTNVQGMTPEVGWAGGESPADPILLVATRQALNAYKIIAKE